MFSRLLAWLGLVARPVAMPAMSIPPRPKVALIVGHNAKAQGAVRVTDGRTEYDWCGVLAEAIHRLDPARYIIIRRTPGTGEIARAYAMADQTGVLATVELHFNGGPAAATGTETLTSGSRGSVRLCDLLQRHMVSALGLPDRGVKVRGRKDRGGSSLHSGKAPAALIEPYFGSNRGDCVTADAQMTNLALAIHRACVAYLKEV